MKGHLPESWVNVKRYHHQYLPDEVEFELDGLNPLQQQRLAQMGYKLKMLDRQYGDMQAILWDKKNNQVFAASDPRHIGEARVSTSANIGTVSSKP